MSKSIMVIGFFIGWAIGGEVIEYRLRHDKDDLKTQITELRQQLKESKDHADYKLNRCMEQLR